MAYINGKEVLFSAQIHDGYNDGFADGQSSMIDESKIIEKTAAGAYISVDDVSEIPHSVGCKVESVNKWRGKSEYVVTGNGTVQQPFQQNEKFRSMSFSCELTSENLEYSSTGNLVYLLVTYEDRTGDIVSLCTTGTTSGKLTKQLNIEGTKVIKYLTIVAHNRFTGGTVTLSNIMLNNGATALPYTPYLNKPETVQVTRTGANLLNPNTLGKGTFVEYNGVPCYKYVDRSADAGAWVIKGCFKENTQYSYAIKQYREDGAALTKTIISVKYTDGTSVQANITESGNISRYTTAKDKTVDSIYAAHYGYLTAYLDLSVSCLNEGSTDLPYEPYNGQTLTPYADGTVEGMTSVSPYMNVFTDNAGATLDVAYRMSWGMQEERARFYNDFQQGKINVSISFEWLALDKANTTSVINALSDTASGQTLTLNITAVNKAFETAAGAADGSTSTEFAALVATKTNWTIVLK